MTDSPKPQLSKLLRAAAELWDHVHNAERDPWTGLRRTPTADGPCPGHDFDDDDLSEDHDFDDDPDWRHWYDAHRPHTGQVPVAVVSACLDDVREAGILHSVALLEIVRKWGFDPRS